MNNYLNNPTDKTKPLPFHSPSTELSSGHDISEGEEENPSLITQDIEDRVQLRDFRGKAFKYASIACGGLIGIIALWLGIAGCVFLFTDTTHKSIFVLLTPLIVLASLAAVIGLATLRFVFRDGSSKEKGDDKATVWQSLFKELSDVAKEYVKKH